MAVWSNTAAILSASVPSALSVAEFQRYWHDVHALLVHKHRKVLRIARYVQFHSDLGPLADRLRAFRGLPEPYDGIAEIWYESREAPESLGGDSEARAASSELREGVSSISPARRPDRAWSERLSRNISGCGGIMTSHVDPTKQSFAAFREADRDGPIHMLNLIRLKPEATYADGRRATGGEAYAAYGRDSAAVFTRLGGKIVWQGQYELMLIGPDEERWDICFIAEYPSVTAFVGMVRDPVYREAVKHRTAGVADSRLIRMAPLPVGRGFGEVPR